MIINLFFFFYFTSLFAAQFLLFDIRMMQEISKGEVGNGKQLGMANYNSFLMNITHFKQIFFNDKMCIYDA